MTAQEKAKEIVDKFLNCYWDNFGTEYAKLCALVLVDSLLIEVDWYALPGIKTEYWEEVKKEIELL